MRRIPRPVPVSPGAPSIIWSMLFWVFWVLHVDVIWVFWVLHVKLFCRFGCFIWRRCFGRIYTHVRDVILSNECGVPGAGSSYAEHLRAASPEQAMFAEVGMADDELRMLALAGSLGSLGHWGHWGHCCSA